MRAKSVTFLLALSIIGGSTAVIAQTEADFGPAPKYVDQLKAQAPEEATTTFIENRLAASQIVNEPAIQSEEVCSAVSPSSGGARFPRLHLTLEQQVEILLNDSNFLGNPFGEGGPLLYFPEFIRRQGRAFIGTPFLVGQRFEIPNPQAPSVKKYLRDSIILLVSGETISVTCIWQGNASSGDKPCNSNLLITYFTQPKPRVFVGIDNESGKRIFEPRGDTVLFGLQR